MCVNAATTEVQHVFRKRAKQNHCSGPTQGPLPPHLPPSDRDTREWSGDSPWWLTLTEKGVVDFPSYIYPWYLPRQ